MQGRGRAVPAGRQRGQALVFISVTTIVVLLAMLVMFSTGQLATHRMKLQNTADAVSYSSALVQARDLNFTAYMNRAMIANQVAVAQITSMTGWARGLQDTYNGDFYSIAQTLADLSAWSAMWNVPVNSVFKPFSNTLKSALDVGGKAMVVVLDFLIDALRGAARVYHLGMLVTIPETIDNVISANDADASLSVLGWAGTAFNTVQHLQFAKEFDPAANQDGDLRNANVVSASMDLFTKNRTLPIATWLPTPLLIDPTRPFTPGVGPLVMFYFHSGGSSLKASSGNSTKNLQAYGAADASGLFVIFDITISILGIPIPIIFPLPPLPAGAGFAWAGNSGWSSDMYTTPETQYVKHRDAANDGGDSAAAVEYGGAYFNPMTAITYWIKASEGQGSGNNLDTNAGLRKYQDLKDNANGSTSNQAADSGSSNNQNLTAPAIFIEVERPSNTIATSSSPTFQVGGGSGGQLDLPDGTQGAKIRAMSKGEAYFSRPKDLFGRSDNKTEYGSLYSPYWQAHIVANSLAEQVASFIGDSVLP
ncbi:MAG: hypothetical protein JO035_14815 [Betaproteobacteria bacterium]|nr:hypothetical protein [Betaproteobacteria bacterium]